MVAGPLSERSHLAVVIDAHGDRLGIPYAVDGRVAAAAVIVEPGGTVEEDVPPEPNEPGIDWPAEPSLEGGLDGVGEAHPLQQPDELRIEVAGGSTGAFFASRRKLFVLRWLRV